MAQNLTNFDEALKTQYLPVLREQLENQTVLWKKLNGNKKPTKVGGKEWELTLHTGRNSGVGSGAETDLPTAGKQQFKKATGSVKYTRARIQVSGPVMAASDRDPASVVNALESEMKGAKTDLMKELNYQLHNDGSAVRALVNGDPGTAAVLTVDNPGTQYLFDDMKIDVLNSSDGTLRTSSGGLTISTVDSSTQATMSANFNAAVADNDFITRAGATDQNGTSYEMMGLKGIIDDGTYVTTLHGLSRSSYAWWKASTFTGDDNGGTLRDLTLPLIQSAITAVERTGGKVDMIVSSPELRDGYVALVTADRRYVNTLTVDGGYTAVGYTGGGSEIPWVSEPDNHPSTIYFISSDNLYLMEESPLKWMDEDGSILSRVSGSDAYEAALIYYAEIATDRPRSMAFLRDVQKPVSA